jgi:hypothetical protein
MEFKMLIEWNTKNNNGDKNVNANDSCTLKCVNCLRAPEKNKRMYSQINMEIVPFHVT